MSRSDRTLRPAVASADDLISQGLAPAASRDVLARVIYGFRLSVSFALIVTAATAVIGIAAGAVQGYFGGWVDLIFQRISLKKVKRHIASGFCPAS